MVILRKPASSDARDLLGVQLEDRPGYLVRLLTEPPVHRERTGRRHFGHGTGTAAAFAWIEGCT